MKQTILTAIAGLVFLTFCEVEAQEAPAGSNANLRVATFNISFNRPKLGQLATDLAGNDKQAIKVARIIRTMQPDILLLNEFDFDQPQSSLTTFQKQYLEVDIRDSTLAKAVYPYVYSNAVNTGEPSGLDLDKNGEIGGGADCFGYGIFPGQYGMVVLSKYPILKDRVRTFQNLLWHTMPNAAAPLSEDGTPWYPETTWKKLRISSKSHWDVPIDVNGKVLHLLASHPTPPAFDGPEDRNGKRNHDEIRLWAEYLTNNNTDWLVDDNGKAGGLSDSASFVVAGDLNADPADGGSYQQAIDLLLKHPRVNASFTPKSEGAIEAAALQAQANLSHSGKPEFDTADFSDRVVGNLRADYVLPCSLLNVKASGVVWPVQGQPLSDDIDCTDHRMVWLDISWP